MRRFVEPFTWAVIGSLGAMLIITGGGKAGNRWLSSESSYDRLNTMDQDNKQRDLDINKLTSQMTALERTLQSPTDHINEGKSVGSINFGVALVRDWGYSKEQPKNPSGRRCWTKPKMTTILLKTSVSQEVVKSKKRT